MGDGGAERADVGPRHAETAPLLPLRQQRERGGEIALHVTSLVTLTYVCSILVMLHWI